MVDRVHSASLSSITYEINQNSENLQEHLFLEFIYGYNEAYLIMVHIIIVNSG